MVAATITLQDRWPVGLFDDAEASVSAAFLCCFNIMMTTHGRVRAVDQQRSWNGAALRWNRSLTSFVPQPRWALAATFFSDAFIVESIAGDPACCGGRFRRIASW